MKKWLLPVLLFFITISAVAQNLDGAWKKLNGGGSTETTCIIADNYFMQAEYDRTNKNFVHTMGGVCQVSNDGKMNITIEFDSDDSNQVGRSYTIDYRSENGKLIVNIQGDNNTWQRIDDGKGPLAGNWRITAREQDGKMNQMQPGPRKTLKILSGTRFQWAAINPETRQFFGTGGGTYSFKNGRYTETIEFFSRDNSRAGMSLTFDGKVDGNRWHHSGKSSKGDPVSEIWTRQSK